MPFSLTHLFSLFFFCLNWFFSANDQTTLYSYKFSLGVVTKVRYTINTLDRCANIRQGHRHHVRFFSFSSMLLILKNFLTSTLSFKSFPTISALISRMEFIRGIVQDSQAKPKSVGIQQTIFNIERPYPISYPPSSCRMAINGRLRTVARAVCLHDPRGQEVSP